MFNMHKQVWRQNLISVHQTKSLILSRPTIWKVCTHAIEVSKYTVYTDRNINNWDEIRLKMASHLASLTYAQPWSNMIQWQEILILVKGHLNMADSADLGKASQMHWHKISIVEDLHSNGLIRGDLGCQQPNLVTKSQAFCLVMVEAIQNVQMLNKTKCCDCWR